MVLGRQKTHGFRLPAVRCLTISSANKSTRSTLEHEHKCDRKLIYLMFSNQLGLM